MQGSSRPDRKLVDAASLCSHLVKQGSVYAFLAEHRQKPFPDDMFADLFPSDRGRPSVPANVIATVMVLQALEGASDREAGRQLETNISWKVACGLGIGDEAFHPTVLVLWRNKLRASKRPQRIFEAVREVISTSGVISNKTRRALDSTVLEDAVQRQDTISLLQSQIRRVRKLIGELAEGVYVREHNLGPGRPPCDFEDQDDIDRLISELVDDAYELVFAAEDLGFKLDEQQQDPLALLALVVGQDVEPGDRPGRLRIAERTAPARIVSVVDPESRHAHKTQHSYRDGYKAHVAAEPETGLVTATDLGSGNTGDAEAAPLLIEDEPVGTEVLGDTAYSAGEFRKHLEDNEMKVVIKPMSLRPAVDGGYTIEDFEIDRDASTITCPKRHHGGDQPERPGPLREELRHLPAPKALHAVQSRADDRAQRAPRPPGGCPAPCRHGRVRRDLSQLPPHDRAHDRLAGARPEPQAPLPRHRAQSPLALPQGGGRQPETPPRPRPRPQRGELGDDHRLRARIAEIRPGPALFRAP